MNKQFSFKLLKKTVQAFTAFCHFFICNIIQPTPTPPMKHFLSERFPILLFMFIILLCCIYQWRTGRDMRDRPPFFSVFSTQELVLYAGVIFLMHVFVFDKKI